MMRVEPYLIGPATYSGIVVSFVDITDSSRSKEKLEVSEERFRALFETMELGVVYQNAEGRITSANPAAERILGLTLAQMQGKKSIDPDWHAMREDGSPFPGEEHPAMVALHSGKKVIDVVMGVFNPKINNTAWINVNAVPMFHEGEEKPFQVYATFHDITKTKGMN